MKLGVWCVGLLLLSGQGIAEAALQVRVAGDRITLRAEKAPLQDILKAIAAAGQFSLRIEPSLADPITVQFTQRPLLDALERLLRDQSMLIRYSREQGVLRIDEVWVLAATPRVGRSEPVRQGKGEGPATASSPSATRVNRASPADVPSPGGPAMPAGETPAGTTAHPDPLNSEELATALTSLADGRAEEGGALLADLTTTHEDPAVRGIGMAALTQLDEVPLEPVATAALADEEPSVRLQALALLADKVQPADVARGILQDAASQDIDPDVRFVAMALLGEGEPETSVGTGGP